MVVVFEEDYEFLILSMEQCFKLLLDPDVNRISIPTSLTAGDEYYFAIINGGNGSSSESDEVKNCLLFSKMRR